ncbi:major facilitator superfamily domain-containing protein [Halenospora varia]|nr:major facilitator superfamily domain-containing protein [Halenospora varia]
MEAGFADKIEESDKAIGVDSVASGSVDLAAFSEYDEYLRLNEIFTSDRRKRLVRKIDLHVLPQLIFLYLLSYVDRSNGIGNAKLFGALADLGMSGQQWNTALSVFFATYAFGGVPSNIALKRFGPKIWIPTLMICVSIVLICAGLQGNFAGWTSFRVLLGLVEAGIGWRFIYVIEGLFTFFVAIAALFLVHDSPAKVGKWLTDEEKQYLLLRHKFSAGGTSSIPEKELFNLKYVKLSFKSFHTYAIALIEFTIAVVVYGISFVLPTIINNLGYTAMTAQAMTVPPYIFACIVTLFSGWAADRYKQRMLSVVLPNIMAVIGFIIIIPSVRHSSLTGLTLFGVFLLAGGLYPVSPAVMAWTALNTSGTMKRAVSLALMLSFSQLGGIMGSNIFIATEAPTYNIGYGICLGMLVVFGVIWLVIYYFILKGINAKRAKLTKEEIFAKYSEEELAEMGDESPLFRYST